MQASLVAVLSSQSGHFVCQPFDFRIALSSVAVKVSMLHLSGHQIVKIGNMKYILKSMAFGDSNIRLEHGSAGLDTYLVVDPFLF